jgi:hypothetical protein
VIDDDIVAQLSRSSTFEALENVCQLAEPELGGSTTAACELREADGGLGFVGHRRSLAVTAAGSRHS